MRHAIPSVLIHAVMARMAAIALALTTGLALSGCSFIPWRAIWEMPPPHFTSKFSDAEDISLGDDLKKNQCRVFLVRPGLFYDVSFMVCKVRSSTTVTTCEAPAADRGSPPQPDKSNESPEVIVQSDTIITDKKVTQTHCPSGSTLTNKTTTTVTELTFPQVNAQGMAGPIFGILGAGLAATAAFAATR